ncbi:hypothetical protein B5C34_12660 [Pacificimonas flava]|uniref:Proteophosphoglycan n=2 Tax=Pacificimonas TaxID=1960290 RepID=A0A219B7R4_9SPHN|nr:MULTISPECIES: DUF1285 domain-containing protein [Pacificimonas]MBZ6378482.1 DUF1285 domain-containing protein [Pacificimonas aurantium]OWV34224.1 hypothetical protein B5C34_12660 [Pacificimonas flava]
MSASSRFLNALAAELPRGRPPIEQWDPPLRGHSDMRIAADGSWYHEGNPIRRERLVRLFSHVLRREGESYVLVTPVEKLTIDVEDTPLIAAELSVDGRGDEQELRFRLNNGDEYVVSPEFPVRVRSDNTPVLTLDRGLSAKLSRPAWYSLAELVTENSSGLAGVFASGRFYSLEPGAE